VKLAVLVREPVQRLGAERGENQARALEPGDQAHRARAAERDDGRDRQGQTAGIEESVDAEVERQAERGEEGDEQRDQESGAAAVALLMLVERRQLTPSGS
jgi:hypothetical protein